MASSGIISTSASVIYRRISGVKLHSYYLCYGLLFDYCVGNTGLEPVRPIGQGILSPSWLPDFTKTPL